MRFGRKALEAMGVDPDRAQIVNDFIRNRDRERVAIQQAEGIYAGVDLLRKRPVPTPFSEPSSTKAARSTKPPAKSLRKKRKKSGELSVTERKTATRSG